MRALEEELWDSKLLTFGEMSVGHTEPVVLADDLAEVFRVMLLRRLQQWAMKGDPDRLLIPAHRLQQVGSGASVPIRDIAAALGVTLPGAK